MMAKFVVAIFCSLVVVGQGMSVSKPRVMSMFDLKPARTIEDHKPYTLGAIYKNCSKPTDKFKLTNVLIAGCTASPCILKKGTEAQVEIDFVAEEVTPNVTAEVYGEIVGQKVSFPLTQPDGCKCGITCPTKVSGSYKYKYSLPVAEEYPSLTLPVLWYLIDAQKAEALCMSVLVKITS